MMKISKTKINWANARAKKLDGYIEGKPITKNRLAESLYRKALDKEFNAYIQKVIKAVEENYNVLKVNNSKNSIVASSKSIERALNNLQKSYLSRNNRIILKWLSLLKKDARRSVNKELSKFMGRDITVKFDMKFKQAFEVMTKENADLIKNVTDQLKQNIQSITSINMIQGAKWEQVKKEMSFQYGISDRRIKRIARDQTAKATQSINELMQQDSGAVYWKWVTVGDNRVSTGFGGHKKLDGKIYSYDQPEDDPIIDSYGNKGKPSKRPQCRCTSVPVYVLSGYKAKKQEDGSYKIVLI